VVLDNANLYRLVKPYATFTSVSAVKCTDEEKTMGGQIVSVIPPLPKSIKSESKELNNLLKEQTDFYTAEVRDGLGVFYLDVHEKAYDAFKDLLKENKLILATGYLMVFPMGRKTSKLLDGIYAISEYGREVHLRAFDIKRLPKPKSKDAAVTN
jgi:hypothetical protein